MSRFTEEITYTWKIYMKLIDMIIAKIIRDLTMNFKKEEEEEDEEEGEGEEDELLDELEEGRGRGKDIGGGAGKKKKKKDREFTIDEEFFHSVIMPTIYATVVAGLKQEHVSLFNLLFAMEIALKKATVSEEDKAFFL